MLDPVEKVEALFAASDFAERARKMYSAIEHAGLRESDRKGIKKEADLFMRISRLLRKATLGDPNERENVSGRRRILQLRKDGIDPGKTGS